VRCAGHVQGLPDGHAVLGAGRVTSRCFIRRLFLKNSGPVGVLDYGTGRRAHERKPGLYGKDILAAIAHSTTGPTVPTSRQARRSSSGSGEHLSASYRASSSGRFPFSLESRVTGDGMPASRRGARLARSRSLSPLECAAASSAMSSATHRACAPTPAASSTPSHAHRGAADPPLLPPVRKASALLPGPGVAPFRFVMLPRACRQMEGTAWAERRALVAVPAGDKRHENLYQHDAGGAASRATGCQRQQRRLGTPTGVERGGDPHPPRSCALQYVLSISTPLCGHEGQDALPQARVA